MGCWGSVVRCRECVGELVLDGRQIESKTMSKTISDFDPEHSGRLYKHPGVLDVSKTIRRNQS